MVHLVQLENLYCHIVITQSPEFTLGFTLAVVHSMGLGKYVVTCIHHYGITQNIFTTLKILCALPVHPLHPKRGHLFTVFLLFTGGLFTVSIILPFPECHIVGIIQYEAFSDWLLPLSNMHFRLFHVFS